MPSITARVASVLERSVSLVRAACSGLDPFMLFSCYPYPLTAPAVRPLTSWRWNTMISTNSGAVADTTAATAAI